MRNPLPGWLHVALIVSFVSQPALAKDVCDAQSTKALTAAGGALVASGYLTSDQWTTIAGALAVIVGVVWSVIAKRATQ